MVFELGLWIAVRGGGGIGFGWRLARCSWRRFDDADAGEALLDVRGIAGMSGKVCLG